MPTKDKDKIPAPRKRRSAETLVSTKKPDKRTAGKTENRKTGKRVAPGLKGETKELHRPVRKPSVKTDSARTTQTQRKRIHSDKNERSVRRRKPEKPSVAPEVVYLPPKPFSRNRLILRLATVAAVVLALVLGISVFFRIEHVVVYGTNKYSANDIREAAGLNTGDNLLTFSRAQAAGKIIGALPYVENVRFGIKLPDTVNIEITEVEVTYSVQDQHDNWWLVSAEGKILERIPVGGQMEHTQLLGFRVDTPQAGSQASAFEPVQTETDPEGNTIPVAVTQAQKLKTALDIAQYLELNGMISQVASVDLTQLGDIRLKYGNQYDVLLGDTSQLGYKISCLKASVYELSQQFPFDTGKLDISDPSRITFDADE